MRSRSRLSFVLLVVPAAALLLSACAAGPSLEESPAVGDWAAQADPAAPQRALPELSLSPDGRLSGTDVCNSIGGSWVLDEVDPTARSLSLVDVFSTEMACPDIETWFLQGPAQQTLRVDDSGEALLVFDETGAQIGELGRAA